MSADSSHPLIGRQLSHYKVLEKIGSGGMSEVYRARDTRLGRDIALKVCSARFGERFEREARAVAALNHPNICTLHDVGADYLVMELVDGPTLAERINQGPLTIEESVQIAEQIADALEAAHEKGIVHRDLKPANIKINPDGIVKVLDFGLAKWATSAMPAETDIGRNPPSQDSPTFASDMTQSGMIIGTARYMSPEQARGRAVDKRTDIWAFGAVLYEMITGRPSFEGETVSDMIAALLQQEPDWNRVPARARHLLQWCLEKDPKRRLRDIGDARWELERLRHAGDELTAPAKKSISAMHAISLLVAAVLIAATAGAIAWRLKSSPSALLRRFELPIHTHVVSISPDGGRVAYLADGHLQVRSLDSLQPQDLGAWPNPSAAADGRGVFWSPDGQTIAFAADGTLRSIPAAGGSAFVICKIPASGRILGGAWLDDETIVFSVWRDNLYKVPARGGSAELYLRISPDKEVDFHRVSALPDKRVILTTHTRSGPGSYQTEIFDGRQRQILITDPTINDAAYVSPGYLMFSRRRENSGIWALPFVEGPPDISKAVLIQPDETAIGPLFEGANDGSLLVTMPPAATRSELVWLDRTGVTSTVAGPTIDLRFLRISLDGHRAAFVAGSQNSSDLFVRDLRSGLDTRLTFDKINKVSPSWFPAGDRLVYSTRTSGPDSDKLIIRSTDVTQDARNLDSGSRAQVSRDGRYLIYLRDERGRGHLRYSSISAGGEVGMPQDIFRDNPIDVSEFDVSPDGTLLAYTDISDQFSLMLTQFPSGIGRWQAPGGAHASMPRFSNDGSELFYVSGSATGKLMALPVTSQPSVKFGQPKIVIDMSNEEANGLTTEKGYDLSPDGKRFLISRPLSANREEGIRLVFLQSWLAALKK